MERKACVISFQQQYISGHGFLKCIVTGDDVLLLESKHASKEWKHCGVVTFKVVKSADREDHHCSRTIDVCCW